MTIHTIDLGFLGHPHGIAAFLVETDEGVILIETGPHSTLPALERGVAEAGYELSDIKHVFITHIHLDHAGAAWCLADLGAQIYLHPFGYQHMHDPSKLLASAKMIYQEHMDRLWGTLNPIAADQLHKVAHEEVIDLYGLNIKALHTPGHAKHHIAWRVNDVLFTGDVAGVCINDGPVIPPCPPPDINIEVWQASLDLIAREEELQALYLTHYGKVEEIDKHISLLREGLSAYASFMEPYAMKGLTMMEVLPDFRIFVKNYLTSHGLTQADAAAYEAANPSDMSATGLLRYWNKKAQS